MPTKYRIQVGDEVIDFEGPDNLTDDQIEDLADNYLRTAKPGESFDPSVYVGDESSPLDLGDLYPENEFTPEDSSALGSYSRGVVQGGTFNFGDEISAIANAAIPGLAALDNLTGMGGENQQAFYNNPEGFWAAVRNNMGSASNQAEADKALHPTARTLGEVSGAVGTLPIGVKAAGYAPTAIREFAAANPIRAGAVLGGTGGAVSGAGAGEEGTRAQSAALGGVTGLALGGALTGAVELAPAIAKYAQIFMGKGTREEALRQIVVALKRDGYDVETPTGILNLKKGLEAFEGKPVSLADIGGATRARTGVALRTPSDAQQRAIDVVEQRAQGQGKRLAQDIRATVAPRVDVHALDEALVSQRAQEAERLRELALYEEGAPRIEYEPRVFNPRPLTTQELGARRRFEQANDVDIDNEAEVYADMISDARKGSEFQPLSIAEADDFLREYGFDVTTAEGKAASRDLFNKVNSLLEFPPREITIPGGRQSRIIDPTRETDPTRYQTAVELQNLARLPDAQRALQGALRVTEAERARLAATGQDISHLPDLTPGSNLDVRAFDALKRYLDDEVNLLYKRGQGRTFTMEDAANVRALRNDIRERLKTMVPEYDDYLQQYAGSSEMIDALREGGSFAKLSPEQISAEQSRRSTAAQELYRVGAARSMVDDLVGTGDNQFAANKILASDEDRLQLGALGLGLDDAAKLERAVGQERQFNRLAMETRGSQTAQRQAAETDARDMIPTNIGNPYGFAGRFLQHIADSASLKRNQAVNEELLPRLVETDPRMIGSIIDELEAKGASQLAAQLRRRQIEQRASAYGGMIVGSPVALPYIGE